MSLLASSTLNDAVSLLKINRSPEYHAVQTKQHNVASESMGTSRYWPSIRLSDEPNTTGSKPIVIVVRSMHSSIGDGQSCCRNSHPEGRSSWSCEEMREAC
jgi:hypothetical protein